MVDNQSFESKFQKRYIGRDAKIFAWNLTDGTPPAPDTFPEFQAAGNDGKIEEAMMFDLEPVAPETFDLLMKDGFRLLSGAYVRHSVTVYGGKKVNVLPLRVNLENFKFSKRHRKLFRRNRDLKVNIGTLHLSEEKIEMFGKHIQRFTENLPTSLTNFINNSMSFLPVKGLEFTVYEGEKLVAVSFFHLGHFSVNATYGIFDPEYSHRSLGTFTMLLELMLALQTGRKYYYIGYAYDVPSPMDYKKRFSNLEFMNWETGEWKTFS